MMTPLYFEIIHNQLPVFFNVCTSNLFQIAASTSSPPLVTPTRSFQTLPRTLSSQDLPASPTHNKSLRSPPTNRITFSSPESSHSPANSSQSSSPSSSAPNSPAGVPSGTTVHYQRPSTLHGLKHKLHTAAKSIHSPNRRKSVGHIPLSPLARTPSPSPLPSSSSPTRSPSPLAFPAGHHPGSSNTTQSYSPGTSLSTPGSGNKKGFGRPKSAEPGSPLLRRALSPDRLHPRSAESKSKPTPSSISPLCSPALKVTISTAPRVTITSQSPPLPSRPAVVEYGSPSTQVVTSKPPEHPLLVRPTRDVPVEKSLTFVDIHQRSECRDKKAIAEPHSISMFQSSPDGDQHTNNSEFIKLEHRNPVPLASVNVSVVVPCDRTSQHLPRIAEEKDSPTGSKEEAIPTIPLVQEAPLNTNTVVVKDQDSNNINFSSVKNTDGSLRKSRIESKCDVQTQKGKTGDCKPSKATEVKSMPSTKSDTKVHRKESSDFLHNKTEGKNSQSSISEKNVKARAVDQVSSAHSDTGKNSAQEKREIHQVGSNKD